MLITCVKIQNEIDFKLDMSILFMKNGRYIFLIICFCLSANVFVFAQEEDEYYQVEVESDMYEEPGRVFLAEFMLDLSDPVGTFGENVESPGFGISMAAFMQAKPTTSHFYGLDFRYQQFQSVSNIHDVLIDGVYYSFDSRASTNLANFSLKYRYYPSFSLWIFEPYIEGGIGYNWWFTSYSTRDIEFENEFNTNIEKGELSFTYGMTVGMQFAVSSMCYINTKVEYAPGNTSEYHARNDVNNYGDPLEAYTLRKTTTDLVRYAIGVTLAF